MHSGFFDGPPDLAAEVLSPDDRPREVAAKVRDWLAAGCPLVWLVDPVAQTVTIHRLDKAPQALHASDVLGGDDVLPNFRLPVEEIFAR